MGDAKRLQEEIDKNYEAFVKQLAQLSTQNAGKFALMRDREIDGFFDTARDANLAGMKLYPDGLFSVQEVADRPVDLGFFSHAVP